MKRSSAQLRLETVIRTAIVEAMKSTPVFSNPRDRSIQNILDQMFNSENIWAVQEYMEERVLAGLPDKKGA